MNNISKHISYDEAVSSTVANKQGIVNSPNETALIAMKLVAEKCFEPLREWYQKPIKINSFFRSLVINKLVGGSPTSQHPKGEAIDLTAGSIEENKKLFDWLKSNVEFDQLIWEKGGMWIHISYSANRCRKQVIYIS